MVMVLMGATVPLMVSVAEAYAKLAAASANNTQLSAMHFFIYLFLFFVSG